MNLKAVSRGACLGLVLLAAILLGSTSLTYRESALDLPTSIYIGQTILHGGLPYRDAWELRAPGIYFAFALEGLLLGKSIVGVRVFDVLWQFSTAVILFFIGKRLWAKPASGCVAALLYLLLYFSQNFWDWAEPDGLLSLPLALAVLLVLKARESGRLLDWGLSAALIGVAALFKLPYGLIGIGLMFAAVQFPIRLWTVVSRWVALAVGLGITLGLCGLYFYLKGGLRDLLTTQLVFAPHYLARVHAVMTFHDLRRSALRPHPFPLHVLAGIGLGRWVVSSLVRRYPSAEENLLLTWLAVAGLTFFLHGSYLGYHYLPFIAPSALLAAPLIHHLYSGFRQKTWLVQATLVIAAAIFLLLPFKWLGEHVRHTWQSFTQPAPTEPVRELAAYIKQNSSPQDTIFVWGNAPMVYIRSDRRAASRFLCTAYLSIATPGLDYRRILLEELQHNQPVFFVLVKNGPITPALPDSVESFEQFGALKDYVRSQFEIARETRDYTFYVRKS